MVGWKLVSGVLEGIDQKKPLLTVKVGFEMAEEVTDSTTEATEDDASVAASSISSTTSARETAAQTPRASKAVTRILELMQEELQ